MTDGELQALHGRRILVTRPAAQATLLAEAIAAHGGKPISFPLLEIGPVPYSPALQQACAGLAAYDWLVFISPNAVEYGLPAVLDGDALPAHLQIAAIGPGTVAALIARGTNAAKITVPAQHFDSEAMLALPAFAVSRISGKHVLILRGNGGRELLADSLRARGAIVDALACYQRSAPLDGAALLSLLCNREVDALTLSSSEGLRNLLALLDTEAMEWVRALPIFVPHRRIAEAADAAGFQRVILTAPADAGIIEGLCAYNWLDHER